MLRRILIIALVVAVIIVAIFAIQRFLNRDTDSAETTEETPTVVVVEQGNDVDVTKNDVTVVEGNAAGETAVTEDTNAVDQAASSGETAYPVTDGTVDAPVVDGNVAPAEGSTDVAMGGAVDANDPNAGGGIPAESGEASPALGDAVAVEAATGGLGDQVAVNPSVASVVQPGVPVTHTVVQLEWLTQLARCYGTTVADIQAANNYIYPDLIQPGWVVNITNPGNTGSITINTMPCFNYHTVQQGETLSSIATQYGINIQWLARINAIYNYNLIYAGQQLVIPNPVDVVFTQPPVYPYYPGWQYPPVAVPYTP